MVCVEASAPLHMQRPDNVEKVIVNALFGDGRPLPFSLAGIPNGVADLSGQRLHDREHSLEAMTWEIGDTGFLMKLAASVPQRMQHALPGFL